MKQFFKALMAIVGSIGLALGVATCFGRQGLRTAPVVAADRADAGPPAVEEHRITCDRHPCIAGMLLHGYVDPSDVQAWSDTVTQALEAHADALLLVIDSPGGSFKPAAELVAAIRESSLPVHCLVLGTAASAAFWVLQACPDRAALPEAQLLTHEFRLHVMEGTTFTIPELEAQIREIQAYNAIEAATIAPRLGLSVATYLTRIRQGDWIFDPAAAVEAHALDRVVTSMRAYSTDLQARYASPVPHVDPQQR